jgi:ribulose 1,5-bisphosphate synthetase/thiazole synthase
VNSDLPSTYAAEPAVDGLRIVPYVEQWNSGQTVARAAREIPVVDKSDVVVVGGGVVGVMAALSAAERDLSVILIERRNYFGYELTASARPRSSAWRTPSGFPLADAFYQQWGKGVQDDERLNTPQLKRVLHETVAAEPRIRPLLYTICSGAVMRGERTCGVEIYSRSGRQVLLARAVVDATPDARVSVPAGAKLANVLEGGNTASRTVQLRCDVSLQPGILKVPSALGLSNDQILVHRNGDCVLEYAFPVKLGRSLTRDHSRAQADSWQKGSAVLEYLDQSLGVVSGERASHRWFSFAPEVTFSRYPTVRCEKTLPDAPFELQRLLAAKAYTPRGTDGLVATGRILSPSSTLDSLQALLCAGERAGRVAAAEAKSNTFAARLAQPTVTRPSMALPVIDRVDVVVVGGGTSGAPAAIAAARQGASVALVEQLPNLGGTGSNRVNGYYWGVPWRSQLTQDLDSRTALTQRRREKRSFDGASKKIALQQLALDAGVRIYYQTVGADVVINGSAVEGVVIEGRGGRGVILARLTIDATGHGDIAAAAGASFMKGRLSDGMMNESDGRGMRDPTKVADISRFLMRNPSSNVALNVRESRRLVGDYVLTFDDAIHSRVFSDTVCYWRSNYDTHLPTAAGMSAKAQDWVGIMGLWRYPLVCAIPYRCLVPRGVDHLLVASKSYSLDHDASIGGRMQPDLQHLGEVAGVAAAMAVRDEVAPRQVNVGKLQQELARLGILPSHVATSLLPSPLQENQLSKAVQDLGKGGQTDVDPNLPREFGGPLREAAADGDPTPDAMRRLYLAGEASIPRLRTLLNSSDQAVRTDAALVLGMLGERAATAELLRILETRDRRTHAFQLKGCSWRPSLPAFQSSVILLGRFQEKRAVPELVELIDDPQKCSPYLASFVIVALGRIGNPDAAEAIRPFLRLLDHRSPEERRQVRQLRFKNETNCFEILYGTPIHAARALAQLNDLSGIPVVAELLDSELALVRDHAQRLLQEITGQRLGRNREAWLQWWNSRPRS